MTLFSTLNPRRWLLPLSTILFLFISGGYTYIWFKQADWLEQRIKHEITLLQASQEMTLDHDGLKVTGFPWKLEISIYKPRLISTQQGATLLQIDGPLEVKSTVWSPRTIVINALGKTKLLYAPAPQFAPLILETNDFQGCFRFHQHSFVLETIKLYDTHLKVLENKINLEEFTLSAFTEGKSHDWPLTDSSTVASQRKEVKNPQKNRSFTLKIKRMKINDYESAKFPSLIESLEVIAHLEETLNLKIKNPLKEWAQKGGFLEIEKFAFEWGSLTGEGDGTFALDHEFQPLAAFSINLSGLETLLDHLARAKIIHKNVASIAKLSLGLLQDKSTPHGESPRHTIALSLQKGDLSIGPLTIAKLPQIEWPLR